MILSRGVFKTQPVLWLFFMSFISFQFSYLEIYTKHSTFRATGTIPSHLLLLYSLEASENENF